MTYTIYFLEKSLFQEQNSHRVHFHESTVQALFLLLGLHVGDIEMPNTSKSYHFTHPKIPEFWQNQESKEFRPPFQ